MLTHVTRQVYVPFGSGSYGPCSRTSQPRPGSRDRRSRVDERAALRRVLAEQEELRAPRRRHAEPDAERRSLVCRERHGGRRAARDRVLEEHLALRERDRRHEECDRDDGEEDAHADMVGTVASGRRRSLRGGLVGPPRNHGDPPADVDHVDRGAVVLRDGRLRQDVHGRRRPRPHGRRSSRSIRSAYCAASVRSCIAATSVSPDSWRSTSSRSSACC